MLIWKKIGVIVGDVMLKIIFMPKHCIYTRDTALHY